MPRGRSLSIAINVRREEKMKKIKKIIAIAVCLFLLVPFVVACTTNISFEGRQLENGTVGVEYFDDISFESENSDEIKYSLKEAEDNILPTGLELLSDGVVTGIPTAKGSFTFTAVAEAGGQKHEAEFSVEIGQGAIKYADDDSLWIALNKSVADKPGFKEITTEMPFDLQTATGAGGAITYEITEGALPDGLKFDNGLITGVDTDAEFGKISFKVKASAVDCTPATAEFKLEFVTPRLELRGTSLPNARVSEYYAQQIPVYGLGSDEGTAVSYSLKTGSVLPIGLVLEDDGFLWTRDGVLTAEAETARRVNFTVVASATGYTSAESDYTIMVRSAHRPADVAPDAGVITYSPASTALPNAFYNSRYNERGAVTGATASNYEAVSYHIISGLPTGFQLYPTGLLTSERVTATGGNYNVVIEARAAGCEPVRKTFTLNVEAQLLRGMNRFPNTPTAIIIPTATRGETYSGTVAETMYGGRMVSTIVKPDNTFEGITFASSNLPAGMTLAANGTVSGTPAISAKSLSFSVIASAQGFSSFTFTVSLMIQEPMTAVANGIFEAEYIDIDEVTGVGHSGAAAGVGMITEYSFASNNYLVSWWTTDTFEFIIYSSQAASNVTLKLALATDLTSLNMNTGNYRVSVNGTNLSFTAFTVTGAGSITRVDDYTISAAVSLVEGRNVIQIQAPNLIAGQGNLGTPAIDCLKLENFGPATLSWRPLKYNI